MPVSSTDIAVSKSPREVLVALNRIPRLVSGRTGAGGLVQTLQVRIGLAVLKIIHRAFLVKSRGMTDAAGLRWKPLSPYTVSMRRAQRQKASQAHARQVVKERRLWRKYYDLARQTMDDASASAYAWRRARAEGLTTLSGHGGMLARILVDTGQLVESLKPAVPPHAAAFVPQRRRLQVFRQGKGAVAVGTRRKYAADQHTGLPGRRPPLPQRRLWPAVRQWPVAWWAQILKELLAGVSDIALYVIRR